MVPNKQASSVLRYIRKVAAAERDRELPDRELLERFVTGNDETAFAAIVRRHGPMVLNVSLRVLQNRQDAEDVFQATFLIFSRKAESLCARKSVGGWLYTVAYRTAQKARIAAVRRRKYEGRAAAGTVADPLAQITLREAQEALDEELIRLPDKLRVLVVLCYLQGLTRDEAAHQLGWPVNTFKSRLEQARERARSSRRHRPRRQPPRRSPARFQQRNRPPWRNGVTARIRKNPRPFSAARCSLQTARR